MTFLEDDTSSDIDAISNSTVLEGLANSHIYLPSSCGGGGTCGKCSFKNSIQLPITSSERDYLSTEQLEQGYRLGCQHKISEVNLIEVNTNRDIETHEIVVTSTNFITPFIKEIKFKVKSGKRLSFKAGAYMEFKVPAGINELRPTDMPANFEKHWNDYSYGKFSHEGATRHYSLANFDQETDELTFNIRWLRACPAQVDHFRKVDKASSSRRYDAYLRRSN